MHIDNPLEQALAQVQSDERGKATPFVIFCGQIAAAVAEGDPFAILDIASKLGGLSETWSAQNVTYLMKVMIPEIVLLGKKWAELDKFRQDYLNCDWLQLVLIGEQKARRARGLNRVRRIADVLASAASADPIPPPDETEDLMGLALDLTDTDVIVLLRLDEAITAYHAQAPHLRGAFRALVTVPDLSTDRVLSVYAKLESLGLIIRSEDKALATGANTYLRGWAYEILEAGKMLLRSEIRATARDRA